MCGDSGFVVAEKCSTGTGARTPTAREGRGRDAYLQHARHHHRITGSPYLPRNKIQHTVRTVYPPSPTPSPRDPLVWCWCVRTALGRKLRCSVTRLERADGQPSGHSQPACQDVLARRAPPQPSRSALASLFGTETARELRGRETPRLSCWVGVSQQHDRALVSWVTYSPGKEGAKGLPRCCASG